ncbi:glycoside hydrolase family 76 protein [Nocardia colli]|uniref:glycoside hydrolase family 76 protein n=1 Tax=Nocardia colli TaxID=2545717 RepID=UPI00295E2234|nr:glycoside hydrolase family 76 protein [Nocardia colli]
MVAALPVSASAAPEGPTTVAESARRAWLAEQAVVARHVLAVWGLPGTLLGVIAWPPSPLEEVFEEWDYWFQAHLVDCAIDAALRAPAPERRDRVAALVRGIRTRNFTGWTNQYYDDMTWLLLALERADRTLGVRFPDGIDALRAASAESWEPEVGAVRWRVGSDYYNACTNAPTGIALARFGNLSRAGQLADFVDTRLRDNNSGLIVDGLHEPGVRLETAVYSYNQGTAIGLEAELSARTGTPEYRRRATALIVATSKGMTDNGVINGAGGGDGGLFMGILARYLALAAITLRDTTAAQIVHTSAQAAWANRTDVNGLPLFGADWSTPATVPDQPEDRIRLSNGRIAASATPNRDLSVQLSGWMLLEADHQLTIAGL